jgi:3-phosphoshikimate 1-carboxyvinyltransferase
MATTRRLRPLDRPVDAVVAVPGSKSIANRALVCAALAPGTSELTNVPDGDDTAAMLAGLGAMGAAIHAESGRVRVGGIGDPGRIGNVDVHAALAGTTSRFLTALAALGRDPVTIDGLPALRRRQFGPLHDALVQLGVRVTPGDGWGHLPVTVQGPPVAGAVSIPGDVSSQYITALMLIGPSLPDGLRLELTSTLVSRPYVEMTAAVMAAFGIEGVDVGRTHVHVTPHRYATTRFDVEPDASSASYPLAVAAVRTGRVEVGGLGDRSLQGDARFADLVGAMGCTVERRADATVVSRADGTSLRGIDVDMADVSDLVPTVAAVALFAETPTRISGVGFIRGKESDRIGDLARELGALGGAVEETDDGLVVHPSRELLHSAALGTHHDHRLAMAFGVVGTVVAGIEVGDPDVVTKSWPGFWQMLDELAR